MKAYKKITFTLLISSTLAFSGWAGSGDYLTEQKDKKKGSERPVEKDKKKNDSRGGSKKDEGGKKDKKP
ncbi:MAG TPA: hypothetical protein VJ810_38520 [Blastocatellia bacterium]|nr:hypothetical protein [Blastocatellia bacterium]